MHATKHVPWPASHTKTLFDPGHHNEAWSQRSRNRHLHLRNFVRGDVANDVALAVPIIVGCICPLLRQSAARNRKQVSTLVRPRHQDLKLASTKQQCSGRCSSLGTTCAPWCRRALVSSDLAEVGEQAEPQNLQDIPQRKPPREGSVPCLAAWVTVAKVKPHKTSDGRFDIVEVPDPDFESSASLAIVAHAGRFASGDAALMITIGSKVPQALALAAGWEGLLEKSDFEVRPSGFGPSVVSNGLLLSVDQVPQAGMEVTRDSSDEGRRALAKALDITPAPTLRKRFLVELGFVGSEFHGSECTGTDSDRPTIIGQLQNAVESLGWLTNAKDVESRHSWQTLSRVDRGVHARSFFISSPRLKVSREDVVIGGTSTKLVELLQAELPSSIRVLHMEAMPARSDFHHKRSARTREYRYFLPKSILGADGDDDNSAISRLDVALKVFRGRHSFANFTELKFLSTVKAKIAQSEEMQEWASEAMGWRRSRKTEPSRNVSQVPMDNTMRKATVRNVLNSRLESEAAPADFLVIRVVGDGFLYHMMRYIVGVSVAVAQGAVPLWVVKKALQGRVCVDFAEFLAPSCGLVLFGQELQNRRESWTLQRTTDAAQAAADEFFDGEILPAVRQSWLGWQHGEVETDEWFGSAFGKQVEEEVRESDHVSDRQSPAGSATHRWKRVKQCLKVILVVLGVCGLLHRRW